MDTQTDRQTDITKNITYPHMRVVMSNSYREHMDQVRGLQDLYLISTWRSQKIPILQGNVPLVMIDTSQ